MDTEASNRPAGRPRPWLLVLLAVAVGVYLVTGLVPGKSAAPEAPPSKPRTTSAKNAEVLDPADLKVRLDALKQPRPETEAGDRNPFRFYVKPPPPPPPVISVPLKPTGLPQPVAPPTDPGPPPPPPIPLKYIGFMDTPGGKIANFSDCRGTFRGQEGSIIAGQYRLVRIGVESVVMEYVDGRGRTTIRMSGQECVGK